MKRIRYLLIAVLSLSIFINKNAAAGEDPIKLSLNNFLGKETRVRATGSLTEKDLYLKVGVERGSLFDGPYFAGMDVNARSWSETEFDLRGGGGDLYFGKNLDKFTRLSAGYRFDRVDVSDTDVMSDADFRRYDGINDTSALYLNLERSTTDDLFYPTSGTTLNLVAEYALRGIGSDFNFSRYEAEASYFFTPYWKITFVGHARVGWVEDFGGCEDVPFFERYFAGSSSTVRGFQLGMAGPISAQRNPLGGDVLMTLNAEARAPVYKKLNGAVFFDTGRAFSRIDEFGHADFREGAGIGLRYLTPWVVLRVDYGFVVDKKSGEDNGRLHWTLGMPF